MINLSSMAGTHLDDMPGVYSAVYDTVHYKHYKQPMKKLRVVLPYVVIVPWLDRKRCKTIFTHSPLSSSLGTGMIASSSTFCPHPGRVITDLFRLLDAVYGIVRRH